MLQLLRHGSYLGLKNVIGETAVGRILPATLESYFDSCVQLNEQQRSSRDLAITFDYSFLAPPNRSSPSEAVALTNNGSERVIFYDAEPTGIRSDFRDRYRDKNILIKAAHSSLLVLVQPL